MLRAAQGRRTKSLAFQLSNIFYFWFGHEPKEVFFEALRNYLCRQVAAFHGADQSADVIDRVGVAAEQSRHTDVAAHLDHIRRQSLLAKKATFLRDVKIHRSDTPA